MVTDFGVDLFVIKKYNDSTDKIKLLNVTFAQKILSGVIVLLLFCLYSFVQGYQYNVYIPIVLALPVALFLISQIAIFNLSIPINLSRFRSQLHLLQRVRSSLFSIF